MVYLTLFSLLNAYTKHHSTESTLLSVHDHNFIIKAMSQQKITALCLLNLSSAFDTIDHSLLIRVYPTGSVSRVLHSLAFNHISYPAISLSISNLLYRLHSPSVKVSLKAPF